MSARSDAKRDALADTCAKLFQEGRSYRQIAMQLGMTKNAVKSKVWAALGTTPQLARQEVKS